MYSYEFIKTVTLHYVQGCKNKMITIYMYACTCMRTCTHTPYTQSENDFVWT